MSVSRLKKSSILTNNKSTKTSAGNFGYPWASTAWTLLSGTSGIQTGLAYKDYISFMETSSGQIHGAYNMGPSPLTSIDGGKTWQSRGPISYGTSVEGFNGAFVGGGNYITSSAAFCNDINNGWTYLTSLSGLSGYSFGTGNGGFTSTNAPVWVIPYTVSTASHKITYIAGPIGSVGVPSATWTNDIVVNAVAGSGTYSKIAIANDVLVYAGYSNTTPSAGTFFIRYASINTTTGAPGTFSTGTITLTGLMQSLRVINNTFIISTADNKIYTSTDGATWTTRTSPWAGSSPVYITPASSGSVIAITDISSTVHTPYYSSDGINWTPMGTMLPNSPTAYTISSVSTSPSGLRWISFTTINSVYRNENAGV